jgi:hypothetical protein
MEIQRVDKLWAEILFARYNSGDRMLSKTMKIAGAGKFSNYRGIKPVSGAAAVTSQEKLAFDGKESEKINHSREWRKGVYSKVVS